MNRYVKNNKKSSKNMNTNLSNTKRIKIRSNDENIKSEDKEKSRKLSINGSKLKRCKAHGISRANAPSVDASSPNNTHKKGGSTDVGSPNNTPKEGV